MGRLLILLLLLLSPLPSTAQHKVFRQGGFLFFGVNTINAYFFDEKDTALLVLDEGSATTPRYGTLEAAMNKNNCLAGINGSFFAANAQHSPLGLLKSKGVKISGFASKGFTVSGILYDTGTKIKLERSKRISTPVSKMINALQGGPFLVEKGKAIEGLNKDKLAMRSFIASNGKGQWCIGITSSTSLHELAERLCQDNGLGDFHVEAALNLDGGSSSAFWVSNDKVYYPCYKLVRNYLGLISRE